MVSWFSASLEVVLSCQGDVWWFVLCTASSPQCSWALLLHTMRLHPIFQDNTGTITTWIEHLYSLHAWASDALMPCIGLAPRECLLNEGINGWLWFLCFLCWLGHPRLWTDAQLIFHPMGKPPSASLHLPINPWLSLVFLCEAFLTSPGRVDPSILWTF